MKKVLVAEDDLVSQTLIVKLLKKWGFDPVSTDNGKTALAILQQDDAPRLALLDWNMPGMKGIEICHALNEIKPADPPFIIMVTAKNDQHAVIEALEGGAQDYITKPFETLELRARINVMWRLIELQAELKRAYNDMVFKALHDPLTGLLNHNAILEVLNKELSRCRRNGEELLVAMLDIDFFKAINDTHGHQVGDDVLRGFADLLREVLREHDHIGRYGGEEFLIMLILDKPAKPEIPLDRIRRQIADHAFATRTGALKVTASIGVAVSDETMSADNLISIADKALYQAKHNGRNCVVLGRDGQHPG